MKNTATKLFEHAQYTKNVIEIKNLTKYYGKIKALDNVNLKLKTGRITGLLGRNGAGKSTLMRCILGFLKYTGEIKIFNKNLKGFNEEIHNKIAFIPDVNSLDDRLTVKQTIEYISMLNDHWDIEKSNKLLAKSSLPLKRKVEKLSKGMKTKLYLLITLSLDVNVLILDEPTLGLDIAFRKEFFNAILGEFYDKTKTIMISTHQVEEVENILQDIIFIDNGKILLYEEVEKLKDSYKVVYLPANEEEKLNQLNPILVNRGVGTINAIVTKDTKTTGLKHSRPTISDLFIAKVGGNNE